MALYAAHHFLFGSITPSHKGSYHTSGYIVFDAPDDASSTMLDERVRSLFKRMLDQYNLPEDQIEKAESLFESAFDVLMIDRIEEGAVVMDNIEIGLDRNVVNYHIRGNRA